MTNFNTSLSAFVTNLHKDRVNVIMEAKGFGPGNFSVPLSPSGNPNTTKWGLHAADDGSMQALLNGTTDLSGLDFNSLGFTLMQANAAISTVVLHLVSRLPSDAWNNENFGASLVGQGLKRILVEL